MHALHDKGVPIQVIAQALGLDARPSAATRTTPPRGPRRSEPARAATARSTRTRVLLARCPEPDAVAVRSFASMMAARRGSDLARMRQDFDAVTAGLTLDWNSGKVVGTVNRPTDQEGRIRPRRLRPPAPPFDAPAPSAGRIGVTWVPRPTAASTLCIPRASVQGEGLSQPEGG